MGSGSGECTEVIQAFVSAGSVVTHHPVASFHTNLEFVKSFQTSPHTMEGSYKVEENINFESFLRVMGVTDDVQIEAMIQATKQVTLKDNGDGTWTQESGLKTSTFPLNKEYKVRFTKIRYFYANSKFCIL